MRYLVLVLLLTGCAKSENFFTADILHCDLVKNRHSKETLAKLPQIVLGSEAIECGITFSNVSIRKNLIRVLRPKYSVIINNDGGVQYNIEHCEIQTDKTSTDVDLKCSDLEKLLN